MQWLAQHATHHPRHRRGEKSQLHLVDQQPPADMDQPVDMVAVDVRDHDLRDVVDRQARRGHRGRKFLVAGYLHPRERHVARRRGLAGVHEPQDVVVLDRPAVDRHRFRPGAGQEQVQLPARAVAREQEAALDLHGASRQGVDLHAVRSDLEVVRVSQRS
jgi:hypothetical protein